MSLTTTEFLRPEGRLDLRRIVVPIDWGRASERALPAAAALARATGALLEIVTVAMTDFDNAEMSGRAATLASRYGAEHRSLVHWDIVRSLLALGAEEPATLLCLAAHGRGAISRALLGSVSGDLVAASDRPILLVGPELDLDRGPGSGPVVIGLDGSAGGEEPLPLAAGWARALGVPLELATVAEPISEPISGHPLHRLFGPPDPAAYLESLATRWRGRSAPVQTAALFDPVGPSEGLRRHLHDAPASLLVVSTRPRTAFRSLLGSVTTHLVRTSPVPVLAVPRQGSQQ